MKQWIIAALAGCTAFAAQAETLNVEINAVTAQGIGESVGSVKIESNEYGLVFRPELADLQPGIHGFHIHAKGSCEPAEVDGKPTAAAAATGHWDPKNSGKHGEPWGDGHMGDLPALYVDSEGKANQPVLAPRLKSLGDTRAWR
jgi:Cu-Zn family superoxide dismutase